MDAKFVGDVPPRSNKPSEFFPSASLWIRDVNQKAESRDFKGNSSRRIAIARPYLTRKTRSVLMTMDDSLWELRNLQVKSRKINIRHAVGPDESWWSPTRKAITSSSFAIQIF
jgi:hypothetical protein